MKKIALLLPLLVLSVSAMAQHPQPNCENVQLVLRTQQEDNFNIKATWKTKSDFPNAPETITVGDTFPKTSNDPSFNINCPNFKATYDGNVLEAKSSSYEEVLEHINELLGQTIRLYSYTSYVYPNIKVRSVTDTYNFSLKNLELKKPSLYFTDDIVIGYKVDGGKLKPLLYNGEVGGYKPDFQNANTIDIYHKNPKAQSEGKEIQRIFIDKNNGVLKIYKKYDFPSV